MASLDDLPELVGFFSYSRDDDADSHGALSALRSRIQGELRGQLGRTAKTFRLWQDKEAIPSGAMWESEIQNSVKEAVFFIPIITPTVVASPYCRFELDAFLAREAALGRTDLVFPILYIDVPALNDSVRRDKDEVLSRIAKRQRFDWRELRHLDSNSTEVKKAIERFCGHIRDAMNKPWLTPEELAAERDAAAARRTDEERKRQEADARRREEEARRTAAAQEREQEAARRRAEDEQSRRPSGFAAPPPNVSPPPNAPPPFNVMQPPPPTWQPGAGKSYRGMAIGSLVCGIISLIIAGIVFGPAAVILGAIARSRMRASDNREGYGMALAGIILGTIGAIVAVLIIIVAVVAAVNKS